jgi:Ala-tRNA(Pro) deacylase
VNWEIAIMTIAATLKDYLAQQGIEYELVSHPYSQSSRETVELSHLAGEHVAKAVVLEDEKGYLMAVVPSTHYIDLSTLSARLGRKFKLASELQVSRLFKDCDPGAIPPAGEAYSLETVMDDRLAEKADVYFEAGDHLELIHMQRGAFMKMMAKAERGRFSHPS